MTAQESPPINWLITKLERIGELDAVDKARLSALPLRIEAVPRGRHLVNEGEEPEQCCLLVSGFAFGRLKSKLTVTFVGVSYSNVSLTDATSGASIAIPGTFSYTNPAAP